MFTKDAEKHFSEIIPKDNPILFYMACHHALNQGHRLSKEDRVHYWVLRDESGIADPFGNLPGEGGVGSILRAFWQLILGLIYRIWSYSKRILRNVGGITLVIVFGSLIGALVFFFIGRATGRFPTSSPTGTPTVTITPSPTPTSTLPPTTTFTPTPTFTATPTDIPTPFPRFVGGSDIPLPVWVYTKFYEYPEKSHINYLENETITTMLTNNYYGSPVYVPSLKGRLAFLSNRKESADATQPDNRSVFFVNDTNLPIGEQEQGVRVLTPNIDWRHIRYAVGSGGLFATICDGQDICIVNPNLAVNRYYAVDDGEKIALQRVLRFDDPIYAGDPIPITIFDWLAEDRIVFSVANQQDVFEVKLASPAAERLPDSLTAELFRESRENEIILDMDAVPVTSPNIGTDGSPAATPTNAPAPIPQMLLLIKRIEPLPGESEYVFQTHPAGDEWPVLAPLHFLDSALETPPLQIQWGPYGQFIAFTAFSKTPFTYLGDLGGQPEVDCELGCLFVLDTTTDSNETYYIDLGSGVREFWWGVP